jgi:hypothetical protein
MNLDRFRASPAGRVIRAGQGDASYWAFAPNPLPPGRLSAPRISCLQLAKTQ